MVGVPGRSKGCHTCRRRRVKCTEEKPICDRCVRGGFECMGYVRDTQWRHLSTAPDNATLTRLVERPKPKPTAELDKSVQLARPKPLTMVVPTPLRLDGFQDDVCFAFIFSNFVWRGYGGSWLQQSARGLLGPLAYDSAKALAETSFGKSQKSLQAETQGRLKYGRALQSLIAKLGNKQQDSLRDLIVPVLLLLMHAATLTNQSAAVFHLQGLQQLLRACGPQTFQHQPLRDAYEAARATILVASIIARKQTFLDSPEWHSIPYALDPALKSSQSQVLDIMTSLPRLLEDHKRAEQMLSDVSSATEFGPNAARHSAQDLPAPTAMLRAEVVHRASEKLTALFLWRIQWQEMFGSQVSASTCLLDPTATSASGNAGLNELEFSEPSLAADIALYNAALMWLVALITDLEPPMASTIIKDCAVQAKEPFYENLPFNANGNTRPPEPTSWDAHFYPLACPGVLSTVRDAAVEIYHIFRWQSRDHRTSLEASCVYMFPIGLATCVLDKEPEYRWRIRAMLDANTFTKNYAMSDVQGQIQPARPPREKTSVVPGHTSITNPPLAETQASPLTELLGFASNITRELVHSRASWNYGGISPEAEQSGRLAVGAADAGLVHMLLLRGRADS